MALRLLWLACPAPFDGATRDVFLVMAAKACDRCGFEWPGIQFLAENAKCSERTAQVALKALADAGAIQVHAYPKGGRGRTTEYVVMPNEVEHVAPCDECRIRRGETAIQKTGQSKRNGADPALVCAACRAMTGRGLGKCQKCRAESKTPQSETETPQ